MRKKFNVVFLFMIFIMFLNPIQAQVHAADARMVTSDGFFTGYSKAPTNCAISSGSSTFFTVNEIKDEGSTDSDDADGDTEGFITSAITDLLQGALDGIKGWIGKDAADTLCNLTDTLGLFSQIYIFSHPVNVTHIQALMSVTGIVQWISLTLMVFGILYFGYQIVMGQAEIDPFPFALKYFLSMFFVYYAPYFVQDILNVNNLISNALSNYQITLGGVNASVGAIIPMSFVGFITNASGATGWLSVLVLLIVVVMTLIPLLKLVVWWYLRLFKIFLYTAISPLMFASLAFPIFSSTFFTYLTNLVKEIFSQFFVILAVLVTGAFISQLPFLQQTTSMGVIGLGIALYAAFSFLHEVPNFATALLSGKIEGGPKLNNFAANVGSMRSNFLSASKSNTRRVARRSGSTGRGLNKGITRVNQASRKISRATNFGTNKFK